METSEQINDNCTVHKVKNKNLSSILIEHFILVSIKWSLKPIAVTSQKHVRYSVRVK